MPKAELKCTRCGGPLKSREDERDLVDYCPKCNLDVRMTRKEKGRLPPVE